MKLDYFNFWVSEPTEDVHPDTQVVFRYVIAGLRKHILDGFHRLALVAQDDGFDEQTTLFELNTDHDIIVGRVCLRSSWGTLKATMVRGKEQVEVLNKVLK